MKEFELLNDKFGLLDEKLNKILTILEKDISKNTQKMREHIEQSGIKDELISVYYNPKNIKHFLDRGDVHEGFESRWI